MASNAQNTPNISQPAKSTSQQHEADLLRALEISPFELAFLEKHLLGHGWVPNTTDEAAIKEAVYDFRVSFVTPNRYKFCEAVERLNTLFDAYPADEEIFTVDEDAQDIFDRRLNRETAKYNAVRSLITDLAIRESRKRENGGKAS